MADLQVLSLENEVFSKFAFYSALLLLKMMCVGLWTSKHRVVKKVFISPEDYTLAPSGKEFLTEDPDIERARRSVGSVLGLRLLTEMQTRTRRQIKIIVNRFIYASLWLAAVLASSFSPDRVIYTRCHRNDMENIPVFILLGFLYVLTKPDVWTASLLFRVFTSARFAHTIVYLNAIPQPARVLAFTGGLVVNLYLAGYLLSVASY